MPKKNSKHDTDTSNEVPLPEAERGAEEAQTPPNEPVEEEVQTPPNEPALESEGEQGDEGKVEREDEGGEEAGDEGEVERDDEQGDESGDEKDEEKEKDHEAAYSKAVLEAVGVHDDELVSPRMMSIIESLLFVSDKPLPLATLRRVLGEGGVKRIKAALKALAEVRQRSGVQLVEVAGGYQLRTHPLNSSWVRKLNPEKPVRLSRAALEALAIVAYRQPITRAEVDEIRGVDSGGVLRVLLERSLLKILGKKQEPGRPLLYGTSKEFLTFFGLKDLSELPSLREFQELSDDHKDKVEEQKFETLPISEADLPNDFDEKDGRDPVFAALAAISRKTTPEKPDEDPELDKAFEAVDDASKRAKGIQKELSQAGLLGEDEGATESKAKPKNKEQDKDKDKDKDKGKDQEKEGGETQRKDRGKDKGKAESSADDKDAEDGLDAVARRHADSTTEEDPASFSKKDESKTDADRQKPEGSDAA